MICMGLKTCFPQGCAGMASWTHVVNRGLAFHQGTSSHFDDWPLSLRCEETLLEGHLGKLSQSLLITAHAHHCSQFVFDEGRHATPDTLLQPRELRDMMVLTFETDQRGFQLPLERFIHQVRYYNAKRPPQFPFPNDTELPRFTREPGLLCSKLFLCETVEHLAKHSCWAHIGCWKTTPDRKCAHRAR